jgi:hypothetical protein
MAMADAYESGVQRTLAREAGTLLNLFLSFIPCTILDN